MKKMFGFVVCVLAIAFSVMATPALGATVATPATITVPAGGMMGSGFYWVKWDASATPGVSYVLQEAFNPSFTEGVRYFVSQGLNMKILYWPSGMTYYYRVKAKKDGWTDSAWLMGNSGCAVPGTATVVRPSALSVPVADPDGTFTIQWQASSSPGVTYALEEAADPAFTVGRRVAYTGTDTSSPIAGRSQNKTFYYRVRAIMAGLRDSPWRIENHGCAVPGTAATGVPTSILVPGSDADGGYPVSWGASATIGAVYILEEATNAIFTAGRRIAYTGTSLTTAITRRVIGKTYFYRVRAVKPGRRDSAWRPGTNGCVVALPPITTPLNDTGITRYGSASQNNLITAPAGFEGQDADYGRDPLAEDGVLLKEGGGNGGFDFTKLDGNGNALPASAVSWSCVRDNHTGLVWEEKTNDGGLRHQDWYYSWYNSDPATNGGAVGYLDPGWGGCGGTLTHCNTEAYAAAVNSQGLCGASDWRLPNRQELQSIVDYGRINPSIDTGYFPHTVATWFWFWSSSPVADYSGYAWTVRFSNGFVNYYNRDGSGTVRLVRGGQ